MVIKKHTIDILVLTYESNDMMWCFAFFLNCIIKRALN